MMIAWRITRQLTGRLKMDAELRGELPKHDGNTVYKDKKEAAGENREHRDEVKHLGN